MLIRLITNIQLSLCKIRFNSNELERRHSLFFQFLPPARQQACRNLLKEYYASLCKHVISDHKQLKNAEKHNRKILQVCYVFCYFYRPQTKLRKGNVFTSMCREFCPWGGGGVHPLGRQPPPGQTTPTPSGRHPPQTDTPPSSG